MSNCEEWRDIKYKDVFEQEVRGLMRRKQHDPNCTVEDIKGTLKNLYIMEGANQDGRGVPADIVMSATIAAYEHVIADWANI